MFYAEKRKKVQWAGLTENEMRDILEKRGIAKYRANQLYQWVYKHKVMDFDEMKNLPKSLIDTLRSFSNIRSLNPEKTTSGSSTKKYLFTLNDGHAIETVYMKGKKRTTLCLSTQIGCTVGCRFCATGSMTYQRNLTAGEIVDQFIIVQNISQSTITNVVFMGMGEPFLNYQNTIKAATLLNDLNGINLGARRITISTAGIVPKIKQFTDENHRFKLAVSLNGTTQDNRRLTMPITDTYSLKSLIDSAEYYYEKSKRMITFEYVLLKDVNDFVENAKQLKSLIGNIPCKVNLIPYNEIEGEYKRPSKIRLDRFFTELEDAKFTVTVRHSQGTTIDAGCGQLAVRNTKG